MVKLCMPPPSLAHTKFNPDMWISHMTDSETLGKVHECGDVLGEHYDDFNTTSISLYRDMPLNLLSSDYAYDVSFLTAIFHQLVQAPCPGTGAR